MCVCVCACVCACVCVCVRVCVLCVKQWRRLDLEVGEANITFMASAGARAYKGVWGQCPQWDPGAKPLVRVSEGRSPPEAEAFLALKYQFSCKNVPILIL